MELKWSHTLVTIQKSGRIYSFDASNGRREPTLRPLNFTLVVYQFSVRISIR